MDGSVPSRQPKCCVLGRRQVKGLNGSFSGAGGGIWPAVGLQTDETQTVDAAWPLHDVVGTASCISQPGASREHASAPPSALQSLRPDAEAKRLRAIAALSAASVQRAFDAWLDVRTRRQNLLAAATSCWTVGTLRGAWTLWQAEHRRAASQLQRADHHAVAAVCQRAVRVGTLNKSHYCKVQLTSFCRCGFVELMKSGTAGFSMAATRPSVPHAGMADGSANWPPEGKRGFAGVAALARLLQPHGIQALGAGVRGSRHGRRASGAPLPDSFQVCVSQSSALHEHEWLLALGWYHLPSENLKRAPVHETLRPFIACWQVITAPCQDHHSQNQQPSTGNRVPTNDKVVSETPQHFTQCLVETAAGGGRFGAGARPPSGGASWPTARAASGSATRRSCAGSAGPPGARAP